MKRITKALSVILILALVFSLVAISGCGKGGATSKQPEKTTAQPVAAISAAKMKIGVLAQSDFGISSINYQKDGIEAAAKALKLDVEKQIIYKPNVTDVTFDADAKFTTAAETTTTAAAKTTTAKAETTSKAAKKGEAKQAVPVETAKPDTAAQAVSNFVKNGCNVIIATSEIYKDYTEYLAKQLSGIIFLQYGKGESTLTNLSYYSDKMYEAFYVAGYTAGKTTVSNEIAFVAGTVDDTVKQNVNAFASGAAAANSKAKVKLAPTNVSFDLVLERTVVEDIAKKTKCDVLAQSVYTALPQVAAEEAKIKCIGYGYDMSGDAKTNNLFSVVWDWSKYFSVVLTEISKGTFAGASYEGGIKEGVVALTDLRIDGENMKKIVDDAKKSVSDGTVDVLGSIKTGANGYAANVTTIA